MDKIKIGFLSNFSPEDRKAASGTNYKIGQSLKELGEVEWIPIRSRRISPYLRKISKLAFRLIGKNIDLIHTKLGARLCYEPINPQLLEGYDIICAFFCMQNIYNLKSNTPIVYFSDATFPAMIDYYPSFTNLMSFNKRQGCEMERQACCNSEAIVLSSNWAKQSAVKDLRIKPEKINIIEYGANIDDKDIIRGEKPSFNSLNILFLGVNWDRKGGDLAAETTIWLNDNGIPATLNIVGVNSIPKKYQNVSYIKLHGFLNKNIKSDYNRLINLIRESHCLLLPTKNECSAIAFSEASAYGLPIFTHDTGGVGNYVINGVNGYRLPIGSSAQDFGKIIKDCYESGTLKTMSESAIELHTTKLNWKTWKEKVENVIRNIVDNNYTKIKTE